MFSGNVIRNYFPLSLLLYLFVIIISFIQPTFLEIIFVNNYALKSYHYK